MNSGFSLVEVMVAAFVGLLVIGLVLMSFITLSISSTADARYATMHHGIRNCLDRMSRDVHSASAVTQYDSDTSFTVDAVTETGTESVQYLLNDGEMYRKTSSGAASLADKVASILVTMYDSDGSATVVPDDATAVEVSLFTSNLVVRVGQTDALRMRATLRNK